MPATSVDTFFACSLMVILVLSAMAGASKLLYPQINNAVDEFAYKRYEEIAKYLLLNPGEPSNWGSRGQIPDRLGLSEADAEVLYALDIDKVSMLNSENQFALSYSQMFSSLKIPDISLKLEIKPMFEVRVNLTTTIHVENQTIYHFEVYVEKHGVPVEAELKFYVVAENHFEANQTFTSNGVATISIMLPESIRGTALLAVFAKALSNAKMVSFNIYAFNHNQGESQLNGEFLRLSPLNYTLYTYSSYQVSLAEAYALTFNYYSTLVMIANDSQSATYSIPCLRDASPTVLVVTGTNSTTFFTEWVSYPQVPLQIGANFTDLSTISNVFAYSYIVTINSALYECRMWFGGLRE
jgi:hypothetical protein